MLLCLRPANTTFAQTVRVCGGKVDCAHPPPQQGNMHLDNFVSSNDQYGTANSSMVARVKGYPGKVGLLVRDNLSATIQRCQ